MSIYARVGLNFRLIYCERALSWDRVYALFERFQPYIAGCDRGPGIHVARKFAAKFRAVSISLHMPR